MDNINLNQKVGFSIVKAAKKCEKCGKTKFENNRCKFCGHVNVGEAK